MQNKIEPKFEILHMAPANTNSLLVTVGDNCVIFDPWGTVDAWKQLLTTRNLHPIAIYATHGHSDHISAAPGLAEFYDIPWYLNHADNDIILWGNPILDVFNIAHIEPNFTPAQDIPAGEYEILPNVWMRAIDSPGHTRGGMMYLFPDFDILLSGDTIFRDGVGRTDLPGGDTNALDASISNLFQMDLPDETYVVHGHGVDSTIGWLRENHPAICHGHCEHGHCCHNDEHDCHCNHCRCHNHN